MAIENSQHAECEKYRFKEEKISDEYQQIIQVQCFHSYRIQGLHAGKRVEEVIAYVRGPDTGSHAEAGWKVEISGDRGNGAAVLRRERSLLLIDE